MVSKSFFCFFFRWDSRIPSEEEAKEALGNHTDESDFQTIAKLKMDLKMSRYYEEAKSLAKKFTFWSKNLKDSKHRYIICSRANNVTMFAIF